MRSILLIEDNTAILENLTEYLELEGYKIFSATNEKKGVKLAMEFMPDLVMCAMPNPGIEGHEDLPLLISIMTSLGIPFIFSSTRCESINRSEALELGADDYIVKPFELEMMLQMVEACIKPLNKKRIYIS